MPGYLTKQQTVSVGGTDYHIRSLLDSQQYADPLGEAEQRGISPASWSLFGLLWPSARVLALLMSSEPLAGLRVLVTAGPTYEAWRWPAWWYTAATAMSPLPTGIRAARIFCGKTCC